MGRVTWGEESYTVWEWVRRETQGVGEIYREREREREHKGVRESDGRGREAVGV